MSLLFVTINRPVHGSSKTFYKEAPKMDANNTTMNNGTTEETKSALKIDIEPMGFNATADVAITTTDELCKVINSIFGVFGDYYGCSLEVQFQPNMCAYIVVPKLVFEVLPKEAYVPGKYFAFMPFDSQPANDILGRVQRLSRIAATSGARIDITDDGKTVLEDFLLPGVKKDNAKFNWNEIFTPEVINNRTVVKVYKLDICTILKKIYGDKIEGDKKGRYYYQITPTYKINQNAQYKFRDNWAINILRLNSINMEKGLSDLGYGVPSEQGLASVITDRV